MRFIYKKNSPFRVTFDKWLQWNTIYAEYTCLQGNLINGRWYISEVIQLLKKSKNANIWISNLSQKDWKNTLFNFLFLFP